MDKLTKRIRCNPDGSLLIKRWDNGLVQTNKFEVVYETETGYQKMDGVRKDLYKDMITKMPEVMNTQENRSMANGNVAANEEYIQGWETEIEY